MKFLIKIHNDSELVSYEAVALAFTLASFDHQVQLAFADSSLTVLSDKNSRVYGMIQSLELYDLPPALHSFSDDELATLDGVIRACFCDDAQDDTHFDSVLIF